MSLQLLDLFPPFPVLFRDSLPSHGEEGLQDASLQVRMPLQRWGARTGKWGHHSHWEPLASPAPRNWVWIGKECLLFRKGEPLAWSSRLLFQSNLATGLVDFPDTLATS